MADSGSSHSVKRIKIGDLPKLSGFSTYGYPYLVGNTHSNSHTGIVDAEDMMRSYLSEHGGSGSRVTLSAINSALSHTSEQDYDFYEYKFLMYYNDETVRVDGVYYLSEYFSADDHDQLNEYLSEYLSAHTPTINMNSYMYHLSQVRDIDYEEHYLMIQGTGTPDGSVGKINADSFIATYLSNHAYEIYELISQYLN